MAPGSREPPETARHKAQLLARSALIFAGGRATRLGGVNKALLDVGGQPIVARILAAVRPLADECVLLTNDDALGHLEGVRLVFDPEPHAGVLPALAAGLEAAGGEICLAVACDMPFVSRRLFDELLEMQRGHDVDVVIPRTSGYLEPMHAVYRRETVLQAIRSALARGEQRMISYLSTVRVREVVEDEWRTFEPGVDPFFNVNTPEDLERARALAAQVSGRA